MMNKVTLIGRVLRKPEVKINSAGIRIARITLATTEIYNDNIERTEYHSVVVWKNLVEVAKKHLVKGSIVYVEGRIRTSVVESNEDRTFVTDIVCHKLHVLPAGSIKSQAQQEFAEYGTIDCLLF